MCVLIYMIHIFNVYTMCICLHMCITPSTGLEGLSHLHTLLVQHNRLTTLQHLAGMCCCVCMSKYNHHPLIPLIIMHHLRTNPNPSHPPHHHHAPLLCVCTLTTRPHTPNITPSHAHHQHASPSPPSSPTTTTSLQSQRPQTLQRPQTPHGGVTPCVCMSDTTD